MSSSRNALLSALATASQGLVFISESDAPFTIVDAPALPFSSLDEAAVRLLAGRPSTDAVTLLELDDFMRNAVADQPWHAPDERVSAERYRALARLIHSELPGARVYRVGHIDVAVLILGGGPDGATLGLATHVIET